MSIILADPVYNPNFLDPSSISSGTKLARGVTIAKFLGAYGDKTPFTWIHYSTKRLQIARNLYPHAEMYRMINGNTELFSDVRLIISEGIYAGGVFEVTGGDNLKKSDGRMVVYQVIGRDGKIDHEKTFEIAEYWKDYVNYESLTLEYDTLNPDNSMTSQIVVEMPEVPESLDVKFSNKLATTYNTALISTDELVEVLEK